MDVDETFKGIGEFGPYQQKVYFFLCLMPVVCCFHTFASSFILATPNHRCALPDWPNDTYAIQSEEHFTAVNKTIPPSNDEYYEYSQCKIYQANGSITACNKWVYDQSIFLSTFASEQNLVCDDELKTSLAGLIYFGSGLVGAIVLGTLGDLIGRKKVIYIGTWLFLVTGLSLPWVPTFWMYCVLRFLIGLFLTCFYATPFVLGLELVGPRKRIWAGIVLCYFYAAGIVILAGVGYLLRDWVYLQIAISVPAAFFLSYWWLIPESPRWYISKGKFKEAEQVIRKIARKNKKTVPEKAFENLKADAEESGRIWHLLDNVVLLLRTIVILVNWTFVSMCYYGLSLNTEDLSGDFYVNFFLSGLAEFPAYTLCILLMDRIGRKKLHISCMILGGLACVCTIFTMLYADEDLQAITVTLAMLGKVGIAAAYAIIYVWSAELFPTVVRNAGIGLSSTFANTGAMISPYVADLNKVIPGQTGRAIPFVIFGGCSVIAGVMALILPETLNQSLPETIEDGKQFGRKRKTAYYLQNQNTKSEEDGISVVELNHVKNYPSC